MFQKYLIGHLCCLAAREQQRKGMFITCSCVCTDWGTCRLGFWQMYRMSCIIYVRSLSYAQKPDVPSINESLCSKHGGARRRKPNNNKHSFFVTNSSHFGTTDKRTFQDSWQQEAWNSFFFFPSFPPQCFSHTWIYLFFHGVFPISGWWGTVFFYCSKMCAASRSTVFGRETSSLSEG